MFNMRKILDNIKILLADERGRALVKLSAYLLFMFFVILYARMLVRNSDNEQNLKTPYEKFISQIEYTADINYSGEEFSLIGGNITSFTYGEEQYIVVDSKLKKDEIEVDDFEIYFWEITPKFIGKILDNKEPEYTSNYKDGLVKKGYKISLYEFLKNYNVSKLNIEDLESIPDEYIEVVVDDTGRKIELVTLNLDSYYKFVTGDDKEFNLEIKY